LCGTQLFYEHLHWELLLLGLKNEKKEVDCGLKILEVQLTVET